MRCTRAVAAPAAATSIKIRRWRLGYRLGPDTHRQGTVAMSEHRKVVPIHHSHLSSAVPLGIGLWNALIGIWHVFRTWRERSRSRAQLAELPDRMLRDIGVAREDARTEARKPFWER